MSLHGRDSDQPALLDVAAFLWDVSLLYQTSVLGAASEYARMRVPFSSPWYFTRASHKRIQVKHRLRVEHLSHDSPLDLTTIVAMTGATIAGVVGVANVIEKVAKVPLERRKLRLEIEKLEREKSADERSLREDLVLIDRPDELRRRLRLREAEAAYDHIAARVEATNIKIEELDIEVTELDIVLSLHLEREK